MQVADPMQAAIDKKMKNREKRQVEYDVREVAEASKRTNANAAYRAKGALAQRAVEAAVSAHGGFLPAGAYEYEHEYEQEEVARGPLDDAGSGEDVDDGLAAVADSPVSVPEPEGGGPSGLLVEPAELDHLDPAVDSKGVIPHVGLFVGVTLSSKGNMLTYLW
jgi:hypothetical protein